MPYTLTMSLLWLGLAGVAGAVVGYLFRGRTSVVATDHHPAGHQADRRTGQDSAAADVRPGSEPDDEVARLRQHVERLDTQLSITVAERDRLRHRVEGMQAEGMQAEGMQVEGTQVEGTQVEGTHVEGRQVEESCDPDESAEGRVLE